MALATFFKQPGELRHFDIEFGEYLDARSTTARALDPVEIAPVPPGINLVDVVWVPETRRLQFWVQGGENKGRYLLTAWLWTAGGERLEADVRINIKESS